MILLTKEFPVEAGNRKEVISYAYYNERCPIFYGPKIEQVLVSTNLRQTINRLIDSSNKKTFKEKGIGCGLFITLKGFLDILAASRFRTAPKLRNWLEEEFLTQKSLSWYQDFTGNSFVENTKSSVDTPVQPVVAPGVSTKDQYPTTATAERETFETRSDIVQSVEKTIANTEIETSQTRSDIIQSDEKTTAKTETEIFETRPDIVQSDEKTTANAKRKTPETRSDTDDSDGEIPLPFKIRKIVNN